MLVRGQLPSSDGQPLPEESTRTQGELQSLQPGGGGGIVVIPSGVATQRIPLVCAEGSIGTNRDGTLGI